MNKKTKIAIGFAVYVTVDSLFARHEYWKLVKKHNDLVDRYNSLREEHQKLHEGAQYFQRVALEAFKKLPVSALEDMQNDLEFLHMMTKEKF